MALSRNEKAQWIINGKQSCLYQLLRHNYFYQTDYENGCNGSITLTRCSSLSNQRPSQGLFRQRSSFAHLCHSDQNKASVCPVELHATVSLHHDDWSPWHVLYPPQPHILHKRTEQLTFNTFEFFKKVENLSWRTKFWTSFVQHAKQRSSQIFTRFLVTSTWTLNDKFFTLAL